MTLGPTSPHAALPSTVRVFERGWLSSNNVLFIGAHETALVDTGYLTHAPQTLALVERALAGRQLDRLLNTHLHSDHCGGNAALQARYGCRIAIPAYEADKVRAWDENALSYRATGQQCARFDFTDTLVDGQRLTLGDLEWQVLAAPGHDPHSLMFYCEREGILISADALWENGFGVIFPELAGESGYTEARAALALIASLDVRLVIPGHGAIFRDARGALARANSRLDYLQADPVRNAQNALKVMLKFLLLERRQITLADAVRMFDTLPVVLAARQRYLPQGADQLAEWAALALVKAGAATRSGDWLINRDA
jgi:glyoxylase-like metal-dependent hydrolase (beta-lactamase superfamily II)